MPGKDKVDLTAFGFSNFAEVLSKITTSNEGHAQFSDEGNTVLFYGVKVEQLSESDFILF